MKWKTEPSNKELLELHRSESIEKQVDDKLKAECISLALTFCSDKKRIINGIGTNAVLEVAKKFFDWVKKNENEIEVDL